jgi:hypothetical protein
MPLSEVLWVFLSGAAAVAAYLAFGSWGWGNLVSIGAALFTLYAAFFTCAFLSELVGRLTARWVERRASGPLAEGQASALAERQDQ